MSSFQNEMVHEGHPVMSTDLYKAAMKGNKDVLIQCLGLLEEQKEVMGTIEADHNDLQDVIRSVTNFGDTLLHILVTQMHNELALMIFKIDRSLMKARNKKSETPLHCAAKVGNVNIIQALFESADPIVVKDAIRETDNDKDTALHLAAKHGHEGVARELMKLDPCAAYMLNMEESFPMYIAIVRGYTSMVITMLKDAPSLACQQYSNGMFPVHVAAGVGNIELVKHFLKEYPDDAKLLNNCGRNFFHIAAEKNEVMVYKEVGRHQSSLINAKDYEGNTPLHIATTNGHQSIMIAISKLLTSKEHEVKNNQGLTPFGLCKYQIRRTITKDKERSLESYVTENGHRFNKHLFRKVLKLDQNGREITNNDNWERIQVIGLGSVLITTIAFAAAFAIPGGYNQDNGIPILAGKYMFEAFILANTQSFILAFTSIFTLISVALVEPKAADLHYATYTFIAAAGFMVLAFGFGSYLILAPVSLPLAIIVLIWTIPLGSPLMYFFIWINKHTYTFSLFLQGAKVKEGHNVSKRLVLQNVTMSVLLVMLLALA